MSYLLDFCRGKYGVSFVFFLGLAYFAGFAPGVESFCRNLDHAYQMALGTAVVDGRVPGKDLFSLYGPLVAYLSAGALYFGHVFGEFLLCALGYAAAVAAAFYLSRKYAGLAAGIATVAILFYFPARFYKWYYWLVPLIGLIFSDLFLSSKVGAQRPIFLFFWGVVCSAAFLLRIDLGAQFLVLVGSAFILSYVLKTDFRERIFFELCVFFSGAIFLFVAFEFIQYSRGGKVFDIAAYYEVAFFTARELLAKYSVFPIFDFRDIFSANNAHLVLLMALPVIYLSYIFYGTFLLCTQRKIEGVDIFVVLVATSAISVIPQAMHMAEPNHFIQTIPPLAIFVPVLIRASFFPRWVSGVLVSLIFLLLIAFSVGVPRDLDYRQRPFSNIYKISLLNPANLGFDNARIAAALQHMGPDRAGVFYTSGLTPSPVVVMDGRAPAGLVPVYAPGLFKSDFIKRINVEYLKVFPPSALVVSKSNWPPKNMEETPPYDVDLLKKWVQEYSLKVATSGDVEIYVRPKPR